MSEAYAAEQWRPIAGYEGLYEVSDMGRVKSLDRVVKTKNGREKRLKGLVLAAVYGERGRRQVTLSKDSRSRTLLVAPLVAAAFIGPRPEGYFVAHGPLGNSSNAVQNLSYKTPTGNALDRWRDGTIFIGEDNPMAKLTVPMVRFARRAIKEERISKTELARIWGVSRRAIANAVSGHTWGWIEG